MYVLYVVGVEESFFYLSGEVSPVSFFVVGIAESVLCEPEFRLSLV